MRPSASRQQVRRIAVDQRRLGARPALAAVIRDDLVQMPASVLAQEHQDPPAREEQRARLLEGPARLARGGDRGAPAFAAVAGVNHEDPLVVGHVRQRQHQPAARQLDRAAHAVAAAERARVDPDGAHEGGPAILGEMNVSAILAARPGHQRLGLGALRGVGLMLRRGDQPGREVGWKGEVFRSCEPSRGRQRVPAEPPLVEKHRPSANGVSPAHSTPRNRIGDRPRARSSVRPSSVERITRLRNSGSIGRCSTTRRRGAWLNTASQVPSAATARCGCAL